MLRAFLLCLFLTMPMTEAGMTALSQMTGLEVVSGTYIYLRGTKDMAVQARARDQFWRIYTIKMRWRGGVPVVKAISGPVEET